VTTVVCFKVPDGIVLGADSAMTVTRPGGENRYDSYHKLSVVCGLPVATAMWGRGAIGQRSIPSLVEEFSVERPTATDGAWTVESLARELYAFLKERWDALPPQAHQTPLHMLVAGYSRGSYHGQVWRLDLPNGEPRLHADLDTLNISWFGVTEAIQTLWWGHSPYLHEALIEEGLDREAAGRVVRRVRERAALGPDRLDFGMPLQNAIDLVGFLVSVEIARERYSPGLARSAPPLDLLVVRAGGVKWVRRKEFIAPPTILGGLPT
jgi:hypothetical protein